MKTQKEIHGQFKTADGACPGCPAVTWAAGEEDSTGVTDMLRLSLISATARLKVS
jgi:hypothetical protein